MAKGRQWKTKLKSYENASFNKEQKPTQTTESVSDKIKRLRVEQQRAEMNRSLRRSQTSNHSESHLSGLMRYETERDPTTAPLPITPGPPPPPSWRLNRVHQERIVSVQRLKAKRELVTAKDNTLYGQSACQAAQSITSKKNVWSEAIPYLPITVKQTLMQHISSIDGLDETLFDLFISFGYSDLCFEDARISFTKFCKAYWRVEEQCARSTEEEEDDWWDHEDNSPFTDAYDGYAHHPIGFDSETITTATEDIKDERASCLEPILLLFLKDQYRNPSSILDKKSFLLFTPLSSTLTSLNISFLRWPNISVAHLLVCTLPHLQQLRTAGCFNATDGPRAISIISQGLRMLNLWDIGFHPWIKYETLCGITGLINWKRDLQELNMLCIENLQEGVTMQVREWLANEGYHRRIKVTE